MKLSLKEKLTDKEMRKFLITNDLVLDGFTGYQYAICLCGIKKNDMGKMVYDPEYSRTYINSKITVQQMLSFIEKHKEIIHKEKTYSNGRFMTVYYLIYTRDEKPTILNDYNVFNNNKVDIEIVISDGNYYRPEEIHLLLSPYTPIIKAIEIVFANANLEVLPFITRTQDNQYKITYYDDLGHSKEFIYPSMESIYNHIISYRLVGVNNVK